jgi:copper chaperone
MTTTLTVEGMTCGHCEQSVEDALRDVEGVTDVSVDRGAESATVEGDADTSALVTAVDEAGYTAHA